MSSKVLHKMMKYMFAFYEKKRGRLDIVNKNNSI